MERYYSLNAYLKEQFGEKIYKLALDGGMSCPNRDGTLGKGGCIFCSAGGSGDFAQERCGSIGEQIELAKSRVQNKTSARKYIAYFQSYTNTYGPVDYLRKIFTDAISHEDVAALSIATRPDCLPQGVIDLLSELNKIKPVWVELGLQTIHPQSASYIRRGYDLSVFDEAMRHLRQRDLYIVVHVILGLPGESMEDMLQTVRYIADESGRVGVKLQLLHVLEGTDLAEDYRAGKFSVLDMDQYFQILFACIEELPEQMVIHRLTGDGPKKILIAPSWSADKKRVLNEMRRQMDILDIQQGKAWRKRDQNCLL